MCGDDELWLEAGHAGRDQAPELVGSVGVGCRRRGERLERAAVLEDDREIAGVGAPDLADDVAGGRVGRPVVDQVIPTGPRSTAGDEVLATHGGVARRVEVVGVAEHDPAIADDPPDLLDVQAVIGDPNGLTTLDLDRLGAEAE